MDRLFSPWRYDYVRRATDPKSADACVLCAMVTAPEERDRELLVVHREDHFIVVLNRYPYNSGHVMIVPRQHVPSLCRLDEPSLQRLGGLMARVEEVLEAVYTPDGMNLGINLGESAGAGIASHVHVHAVPRWIGDTNFMTVVGETRVLPEDLEQTWRRLHGRFAA